MRKHIILFFLIFLNNNAMDLSDIAYNTTFIIGGLINNVRNNKALVTGAALRLSLSYFSSSYPQINYVGSLLNTFPGSALSSAALCGLDHYIKEKNPRSAHNPTPLPIEQKIFAVVGIHSILYGLNAAGYDFPPTVKINVLPDNRLINIMKGILYKVYSFFSAPEVSIYCIEALSGLS